MWSGRVNPPVTPTVTARDAQRWIATEASPLELAAVLAGVSLKTIWRYESGAIAIPALRCAAIRSTLPRLEAEPVVA